MPSLSDISPGCWRTGVSLFLTPNLLPNAYVLPSRKLRTDVFWLCSQSEKSSSLSDTRIKPDLVEIQFQQALLEGIVEHVDLPTGMLPAPKGRCHICEHSQSMVACLVPAIRTFNFLGGKKRLYFIFFCNGMVGEVGDYMTAGGSFWGSESFWIPCLHPDSAPPFPCKRHSVAALSVRSWTRFSPIHCFEEKLLDFALKEA